MEPVSSPKLIDGTLFTDDRGMLQVMNSFNMIVGGIKRFYIVRNHQSGYVRAFHGHVRETKYLYVISGAVQVKIIPLEYQNKKIDSFNVGIGSMVYIPCGYFHGWKGLTEDTILLVLSTGTLEESQQDDIRLPWDTFGTDIWKEQFR